MAHEFRYVQSGDCTIRVAVEGAGPLVLMVHGFPESWSALRHQMGPIAAAGFTAAAIDVRGYGGSGKPHAVEAYDMAVHHRRHAGGGRCAGRRQGHPDRP